jgi:hypothetical protein
MSTVGRINFEPVSDILPVHRRDFPLADKTLADPTNPVALVDGEWMTINSNYKLLRSADVSSVGDPATTLSFPLFMEKGRADVQAIADVKTMVLWLQEYEFDTRIFDAAVTIGSGGAIATVLQPLKVATITIGTRNFVGLVGHGGAADTAPIEGFVTRLPANNGGKLRFIRGSRH